VLVVEELKNVGTSRLKFRRTIQDQEEEIRTLWGGSFPISDYHRKKF
jgi:hypothetical protein